MQYQRLISLISSAAAGRINMLWSLEHFQQCDQFFNGSRRKTENPVSDAAPDYAWTVAYQERDRESGCQGREHTQTLARMIIASLCAPSAPPIGRRVYAEKPGTLCTK
jgi:hypothetical protein